MTGIVIRDAQEEDFAAIVALNAGEVSHTSPMDEARLRALHALSIHHKVASVEGRVGAFLLAMGEGCGYVNENFEWFAARYSSFLYVDRIVVAAGHQGLRLGSRLYQDLFQRARDQGIALVACEYNLMPPNEPSRRFHDKFGFTQVGSQWLGGGAKQVSLQVAPV